MNLKNTITEQLKESQKVLDNFLSEPKHIQSIEEIALEMVACIKAGRKIMSCGNGGSHCDAMHFAEEMTGRFRGNRPALPAIAISDVSHISCVSNDFGFDYVFSRFIEGLGQKGDILLAITTSGNSKNILEALKTAQKKGIKTIGLTGKNGGKIIELVDLALVVPHFGYADRIQEIHIKIIHILILIIESCLNYDTIA